MSSIFGDDPLFNYVYMQIEGETLPIVDTSQYARSLTIAGDTTVTPTPTTPPANAVEFNRINPVDSITYNLAGLGLQNFCYECYLCITDYPPNTGSSQTDLYTVHKLYPNNSTGLMMEIKYNGKLSFYWSSGGTYIQVPTAFPLNRLTHLAIARKGTVWSCYQDGVRQFQHTVSYSFPTGNVYIGTDPALTGRTMKGWMNAMRLTVGHYRYDGEFIIPPVRNAFWSEHRKSFEVEYPYYTDV